MKLVAKKPLRASKKAKSPAVRKPVAKSTTAKSTLPAWVIGCYDGPSDGRLSSREGLE
jgi:hypothetical protein